MCCPECSTAKGDADNALLPSSSSTDEAAKGNDDVESDKGHEVEVVFKVAWSRQKWHIVPVDKSMCSEFALDQYHTCFCWLHGQIWGRGIA